MSLIRSHLPQRQSREVQDAYDRIYEHEKAIAALDDEIAVLAADVRRLRLKQVQHEKHILAYKSLVSLARRLPHELLARIFELCVWTGWHNAPIVLSHVCADWRIAATAPPVWSHVYISSSTEGDYTRSVERIDTWLQRAGEMPLYITLHISGMTASLQESMRRLSERGAQWRTIDILARNISQVNQALALIDHSPPGLRMVGIRIPDEILGDTAETVMDLTPLQSRSSLSTVHVYRDLFRLFSYRGLPLQLTNLSLDSPDTVLTGVAPLNLLLELLAQTPKLVTFSLKASEGRFDWTTTDTTENVDLEELKELTLTGDSSFAALLSKINAPSLSRLRVRSTLSLDRPGQVQDFMTTFLARCKPPLEYLELHDADLGDVGFVSCLPHLANLRSLRLHEIEISDDIVISLADFCPQLTRLDLRWCGNVSGSALVELVRKRQGQMLEVAVVNCSHVKEGDIVQLAKLTLCRVVVEVKDDYCRELRCCYNELYRRRLLLRGLLQMVGQPSRYVPYGKTTGVII